MHRGRYNRISNVDCARLVAGFQQGRDYIQLANELAIARQTARDIVRRFEINGQVEPAPRGGRRASKMDLDMVDYLIGKVSKNPVITLKTLKEKIHTDLPEKQLSQSKGRARRGARAVRVIEGQSGKNVTLCYVSPMTGLVHWITFDGGMTRDILGNFLIEVSEMLQYNDKPYVLLRDNVSSI